ncbi:MAG: PIN domain-containing protein [Ignisphaera sp.]|nr:PIN domain-containing protein [Ignisphaera sp.]
MQALNYALGYRIKPWDGYIVSLAKTIGENTIYTFDKEFEKVEGLKSKTPSPKRR